MQRSLFITAGVIGILAMGAVSAFANTVSTEDFVHNASIANSFEIESSKIALNKSQNSDVKSFAQRMVDDHSKTADTFKDALKTSKAQAKPADKLDDKHQQLIDQLNAASGTGFDSKYISIQTDAHKEAVDLFTNYSNNGTDPVLKDFAAQTLPTLKDHFKHVQELKAKQ